MRRKHCRPLEIYVRYQSGPSALLSVHLDATHRLQLIEALAAGRDVEIAASLELSVLPQWVTDPSQDHLSVRIPIRSIFFNVS